MLQARRLAPGRDGLYYNRARWYSAELGRFLTPDPNATGLAIAGGVGRHAARPTLRVASVDITSLYADGMSLHESRRGHPNGRSDDTGCETMITLQFNMATQSEMRATHGSAIVVAASTGARVAASAPAITAGGGSWMGATTTSGMVVTGVSKAVVLTLVGAIGIGPTGLLVYDSLSHGEGGGGGDGAGGDDGEGTPQPAPGEQPLDTERNAGRPTLGTFGWTGGAKWREAARAVGRGGDFPSQSLGIPTRSEAEALIVGIGGTVNRVEAGHHPSGVSRHTYPHINYTTSNGVKGTIQIKSP